MFSKPLSPFEEFKTNKSVFIVSRRFFLVLNWTTNSRRGILLATTREEENLVNMAQKMASQSSTKQNGEATTREVLGSIVTYTGEEINTFKDDMAPQWKHEKEYAACNRPESWYLEKYKTELNLNSISKTFQDTYHISIATLNFQCFCLDTSFLSVLPPKR